MAAPSVYAAINAITGELAKLGIAKTHVNAVDDYKYRSIDDLLDRLAPLLAGTDSASFPERWRGRSVSGAMMGSTCCSMSACTSRSR